MKVRKYIVLLLVLAGIAACTKVTGELQSFSALPINWHSKTVAIAPYQDQTSKSLEWRSYAGKLEAKLKVLGFRTVSGKSQRPDYIAFIGWGIDRGSTVTSSYSIPQWGVTGYSGGYTSGVINTFGNTATYTGTTTLTPQYGITGYSTGTTSRRKYTRSLSIDIRDIDSGDNVWEGKVVSAGSCGVIAEVIDEMIEIAFSEFPHSGSGRHRIHFADADC